jgi:hypothetical protein
MLIKILIGAAVILLVLIVIVATRPDTFTVARSATINAPASVIFAHVNDLHQFQDWSPWAKLDPGCQINFEGPPAGTGASFAWSGNNKVGQGRMTIADSQPDELVRFRLDFLRPFKASNTAEFALKAQGNQTAVIWSMSGKNNFMFKAVGLFMDCDKMVGGDFEKGLATLKTLSESTARK